MKFIRNNYILYFAILVIFLHEIAINNVNGKILLTENSLETTNNRILSQLGKAMKGRSEKSILIK